MDETHLRANSRLPGPRANLELLARAAEEIDKPTAMGWARRTAGDDPSDVFVIMVGHVALGRLAASGDESGLPTMQARAADENWRIREAVAIGLQRLATGRPERMAQIALEWSSGTPLEARAAVAAVAEPRLLKSDSAVESALEVLDRATQVCVATGDRVLRLALGYAWSVVAAANPTRGLPRFEVWAKSDNADVSWIVRENRSKTRMKRLRQTEA